jgi:CheY-like chemotaxis protein
MNQDPARSTPAPADPSDPKPPPPARILLVDDDPINQTVALNLLRRRGYHAVAVANGKQALEQLASGPFDLVFMDLQMPELDGFQTATQIRRKEAETSHKTAKELPAAKPSRTPIIALTTASQPGTREKCLASGMDDYLPKPIVPRDLFAMVEKYVGQSPPRPAA